MRRDAAPGEGWSATKMGRGAGVVNAGEGAISFRAEMSAVTKCAALSFAMLLAACGGGRGGTSAAPAAVSAPSAGPGALSRFAALKVMVLPTQSARLSDSVTWRMAGGERAIVAALDSALERSLGERGLATLWIFPPALTRAARRNPTFVTEPSAMPALAAVRAGLRKPEELLTEPFASQLRALAGVSDSRYALVPLELRRDATGDTTSARLVLQAAVIDARGSRVVWVGEVGSDPFPRAGRPLLSALVPRVADLVVPR